MGLLKLYNLSLVSLNDARSTVFLLGRVHVEVVISLSKLCFEADLRPFRLRCLVVASQKEADNWYAHW